LSVDGKMYHVRIESHTVFCYYLHEDWRSVVFEQVSTYDVNGVKGYGIFEFLYRSVIVLLLTSFYFFVCFLLWVASWYKVSCCLQIRTLVSDLDLCSLALFTFSVVRGCLLQTKLYTEIS